MKTFATALLAGLLLAGLLLTSLVSFAQTASKAPSTEAPSTEAPSTEAAQSSLEEILAAGVIEMKEGRLETAEALFAKARQTSPSDPRPWLGSGRVAERRNDIMAAVQATRQAYRIASQDADVGLELARLLARLGAVGEALEIYQEVRLTAPERGDAYFLPALILRDVGDHSQAASLLETAVSEGIAPPRLVEELGLRYLALGLADKALMVGEKLLSLYEDRPLTHLLTGLALRDVGERSEEARQLLLRAITLNVPDAGRAHLELGISWLDDGDAQQAMEHLKHALTAMPEAPEVHYRLAAAHRALGDEQSAGQALERFQTLSQASDAEDSENKTRGAALNAVQTLAAANRLPEAQQQLDALLTEYPEDADALGLMAKIQFSMGQVDAASQSIGRALDLAPQEAEYHFLQGYFASQKQEIDLARQALGRALAMDDTLVQAHVLMAFLEMDAERPERAVAHFERGLAQHQARPSLSQQASDTLRQRYADALDALGRTAEAAALRQAAGKTAATPSPEP